MHIYTREVVKGWIIAEHQYIWINRVKCLLK